MKKVTWTKGLDPETGKPEEYDANKPVQTYNRGGDAQPRQAVHRHLPRQHGRQELAADRLQSRSQALVHPGHRELQPHHDKPRRAGRTKAREFLTGGGPWQPFRITGSVTAIDVTTGKVAGKSETPFPMLGGILATPDLVFSGQPSGEVLALDAKTLEKRLGVQHRRRRQRAADVLLGRRQAVCRHPGRHGRRLGQVVHRSNARAEADAAGIDALRVRALTASRGRASAARGLVVFGKTS